MSLEQQLQASIDIIELRKRDSATLAAVIKAAQAELQARKAKLRSDVAELAKQKKLLQRQAAELSSAGYRVRARVAGKDKGTKRGPRLVMAPPPTHFCDFEDCDVTVPMLHELCPAHKAYNAAQLTMLDQAADDAECADADARDDYERQNAARGNEP